jgi:hypothetical protein
MTGVRITSAEAMGDARGSIRVWVQTLDKLFSAIDPSPLSERDLNEETEHFIVSWARDVPADAPLSLTVELCRPAALRDPSVSVREAVHVFFGRRAETAARELRAMFRRGRTSLVIGLLFLTTCVIAGDVLGTRIHDGHLADVLREGLTVAGWVAMWRPMEIFLYNWWPLAADRRLYDRLATMPVSVESLASDAPPASLDTTLPALVAQHGR